jgi:hypothetical protein
MVNDNKKLMQAITKLDLKHFKIIIKDENNFQGENYNEFFNKLAKDYGFSSINSGIDITDGKIIPKTNTYSKKVIAKFNPNVYYYDGDFKESDNQKPKSKWKAVWIMPKGDNKIELLT